MNEIVWRCKISIYVQSGQSISLQSAVSSLQSIKLSVHYSQYASRHNLIN
jgi:hypothetical protein